MRRIFLNNEISWEQKMLSKKLPLPSGEAFLFLFFEKFSQLFLKRVAVGGWDRLQELDSIPVKAYTDEVVKCDELVGNMKSSFLSSQLSLRPDILISDSSFRRNLVNNKNMS